VLAEDGVPAVATRVIDDCEDHVAVPPRQKPGDALRLRPAVVLADAVY
jgi:hypothetical protein